MNVFRCLSPSKKRNIAKHSSDMNLKESFSTFALVKRWFCCTKDIFTVYFFLKTNNFLDLVNQIKINGNISKNF